MRKTAPCLRQSAVCAQDLRLLGDLAQGGKRHGIADGHLGQHLAVDLDAGDLQTVHEGGVVQTVGLHSGGDTGDPQLTEVPLLQAAAHIGLGQRLHDLLVGHLEMLGLGAPVALSQLQRLVSSFTRHHCAFNTCHILIASYSNENVSYL